MTMYRHRVLFSGSKRDEQLGELAASAASLLLAMPYTPRVVYFVESADGKYERPFRVAGFCDYYLSAKQLSVFIRAGQQPRAIAKLVFHECHHAAEFEKRALATGDGGSEINEARANEFAADMAPTAENFDSITAELSRKLCGWYIKRGDLVKARKYHAILKSVDPAAAEELNDDVMSDKERRQRIKIQAEQALREVERAVIMQRRVAEFKRWRAEQDAKQWW